MEGSNTADNLFGHFFFLQHELTFVRLRISEVFCFFLRTQPSISTQQENGSSCEDEQWDAFKIFLNSDFYPSIKSKEGNEMKQKEKRRIFRPVGENDFRLSRQNISLETLSCKNEMFKTNGLMSCAFE